MYIMKRFFFTSCIFLIAISRLEAQPVQAIKITQLQQVIADTKQPLIVNFWATWCLPCIEEIPYFEKITARYAADSVRLLLVSLDLDDDTARVLPFAKGRGFQSSIIWLNETDADYFCPKVDEKWFGSIPATLFIYPKRNYRRFFEKQLKEEAFEQEVKAMLGAN